jgi:hypothetical protein
MEREIDRIQRERAREIHDRLQKIQESSQRRRNGDYNTHPDPLPPAHGPLP